MYDHGTTMYRNDGRLLHGSPLWNKMWRPNSPAFTVHMKLLSPDGAVVYGTESAHNGRDIMHYATW